MKKAYLASTISLMVTCVVCYGGDTEGVKRGTRDHALALRDGAQTKITFRVVDADGKVVTGANAQGSFATEWSDWIKGLTDSNGLFSVEGKSRGEMIYDIQKDGYYRTKGTYGFPGAGDIVLDGGRWLPWNPTNTVVLKQVKKPVPMNAIRGDFTIPAKGRNVGLDFAANDWVDPYGKGKHSDVQVYYEETEPTTDLLTYSKRLCLTFGTNAVDGVRRYNKDEYSDLRSVYEAPMDGYERSLSWVLERTKLERKRDIRSSKDEYFVFRVRTELDDKGNIVKANYGKIYGPVEYGLMGDKPLLKMNYYFNPDTNSTSLEFDPKKNLSGQKIPLP